MSAVRTLVALAVTALSILVQEEDCTDPVGRLVGCSGENGWYGTRIWDGDDFRRWRRDFSELGWRDTDKCDRVRETATDILHGGATLGWGRNNNDAGQTFSYFGAYIVVINVRLGEGETLLTLVHEAAHVLNGENETWAEDAEACVLFNW